MAEEQSRRTGLVLSQIRRLDRPMVILLYGGSCRNQLVDFQALVGHGMISPEDLELFHIVDRPEDALEILMRELPTKLKPLTAALARSITRDDPRPNRRERS